MTDDKRVAVVTGANRGIGFAACRLPAKKGLRVVLTSRDEKKGQKAADSLKKDGLDIIFHQLDVTDEKSIEEFEKWIKTEFGRADVPVNNAGVFLDKGEGNYSLCPWRLGVYVHSAAASKRLPASPQSITFITAST